MLKSCTLACALALVVTGAVAQSTGTLEVFGRVRILEPDAFENIAMVSSKGSHSIALRQDGSLIGWGNNYYGACDIPTFDEPIVFLEAGFSRSAALTESGAFVSWGQNPFGAGDAPDSNVGFIDIASGVLYDLILRDNGVIVSQGLSYQGGEVVPEPNSGWVDIAAFDDQSAGLKNDGTIWMWGSVTDTIPAHDPPFTKIAAGYLSVLALDEDGVVHHFGYNYNGIGDLPADNHGFIDVSAGDGHAVALRPDGTIEAWGWDQDGQATAPSSPLGYRDVECGYFFSLAIRNDGSLEAWGGNGNGTLGLQPPATDLVDIKMGNGFGIGLRSDGSVASWGNFPPPPEPNLGFTAITAGREFAAAIRPDSTIVDWGSWGGYSLPDFPDNSRFVALDAAEQILLGLRDDGSIGIRCQNSWGLHDIPEPNSGYSRISTGDGFCLALRGEDGSIVAWGNPYAGVLEAPEPNSGFVDIFAGHYQAFAIKEDGTVVMWGTSTEVPEELNHDTADLAALYYPYWTSLHADGTVSLWNGGEVPEPNAGIIAVASSESGVSLLRGQPSSAATQAGPLPGWVPVLVDAHPNPFNPQTHITVQAVRDGHVRLDVMDLRGHRVRSVWQGNLVAGETKTALWNGEDGTGRAMPSGTYFLRATGPTGQAAVRKVTLVR